MCIYTHTYIYICVCVCVCIDITLPTKVCLVKATVSPVVVYGCESWTIKKAAAAKSLQSCPTLCDPIDSSPPGSSFPGILQAGILEWVTLLGEKKPYNTSAWLQPAH